ncbi:GumC family protein [Prochlorococcus marinus]|uniref:GumC family protein n=1 Tax=Prochlorococcus marinus TaxID=1219 RepID=UPI001ADA31D4|nr:Wzz/FepE/Etk N-terminal domain-containing protein [Prochlorococcus marinus]MBO8219582.1 hypothetical protein [Prochlorococcus marinus CUG1416]MBW3051955.1 hypothetical protein [Prochlorococcus marinus str. MU1416]
MKVNKEIDNNENLDLDKDQINISYLFNFFFRNKKVIGLAGILLFIFASLFSLTKKRVWQGEFQIVLNNDKSANLELGINSALEKISGLNRASKDLKTEVGILESPSVLLPIFDFINSQKQIKSKKGYLDFADWKKNNLKIELKKGTSILDISYRDKDKDLIIPFLTKMSETYQAYAGRSKKRKLEFSRDFLKKQILLYKEKSSNSLKSAQEFAIDQDLMLYIEENLNKNNFEGSKLSNKNLPISNIEIENIRVQLKNKIRKIDLQLKKIEEMGEDVDQIKYISSTLKPLDDEGIQDKLWEIEEQIVEKQVLFTDEDPYLKNLKERKEFMNKFLVERTIGFLKAEKIDAEVQLEAAKRPKGVLLKYKELIREALRDENTLINLENQLILVELDMSRMQDPWQLITEPSLLLDPVAPSRRKYATFGLIFGIIGGSFFSSYKEKKSGFIYEKKVLEEIMGTEIISIKSKSNFESILLQEKIKSSQTKDINLINLNIMRNKDLNFIESFLTDLKINLKIEFSEINKISNKDKNKLLFLITSLDNLQIKDAINLNKILNFYDIELKGIILVI